MSVEQKLIRLTPPAFASLQQHPATLGDLIEEFYGPGYFDCRATWKGPVDFNIPVPRMIHIDEFTIWSLTDRYEHTALCDAVVGWRDTQELEGAPHGDRFAYASYQDPAAVTAIARGLAKYPKRALKERFLAQAEHFLQAAAPHFAGERAILEYQRSCFELLHRFYREAAQQGEFVLQLIV